MTDDLLQGDEELEPGEATCSMLQEQIRRLQARSSRGLWNLAAFLPLSLWALFDFRHFPPLPPELRHLLGPPPSTVLISSVLVLYSFSAIILVLARIMSGSPGYTGIAHVGFLGTFYVFYHLADALADNYHAVLAAGLTILSLEAYHIRSNCSELIRRKREALTRVERLAAWRQQSAS
ncbi:MAG TPA: menaquinol oxidoreductase [Verrucomicrobiae bacterium]|nr:menaquinol oxidoreductase [Verrucomicrobiae bacterium]